MSKEDEMAGRRRLVERIEKEFAPQVGSGFSLLSGESGMWENILGFLIQFLRTEFLERSLIVLQKLAHFPGRHNQL